MTDALTEHLGYLADHVRLERYRAAISEVVKPGDIVADIGCGFGVLGLLCLQAGAARVWGIDATDALEFARETVARAGFADRYECVSGQSFEVDLPQRADVIICDHVGFFGFDYGIIKLLSDAKQRFLKPTGKLIPSRLTMLVAGCMSHKARATAEAWTVLGTPPEYHWLRAHGINTKYPRTFAADEILGVPRVLGALALGDEAKNHLALMTEIEIDRDGTLDGLVGWFECELAPGVDMTNSPLTSGRISRDQAFLPLDKPLPVRKGQTLKITVSARPDDNILAWTLEAPGLAPRATYSNWKSMSLSQRDLNSGSSNRRTQLSRKGMARKTVLAYCDGRRTIAEVEEIVLRNHPDLFPSPRQIRQFVQTELSRNIE